MPLKTYKTGSKPKKDNTIRPKSGVRSGDSNAELEIVMPLKEHPELKGQYRAIDPDTGWRGWVNYTPPAPPVEPKPEPTPEPTPEPPAPPTPQELKEEEYSRKFNQLREMHKLVEMGVIPETDLEPLRAEVKTLAQDVGVL